MYGTHELAAWHVSEAVRVFAQAEEHEARGHSLARFYSRREQRRWIKAMRAGQEH